MSRLSNFEQNEKDVGSIPYPDSVPNPNYSDPNGFDANLSLLEYRVFPRCPLPLAALRNDLPAELPPLLKGYLRAGAYVCGDPAWDPDFNTADLQILMPMSRLNNRYARHFLGNKD